MKLQNLAIIFIIIMLPIILVLSQYMQTQIDTIVLQTQYDTMLQGATYDAVKAFELNSSNNEFSTVADSLKRDTNAAINTFVTTLATNMGVAGYTKTHLMPYIPAVVFTLYDGYYIYSPTYSIDDIGNVSYDHVLKPYIYYTSRYIKGNIDVVVNYTLDNYLVVYGYTADGYITKSGYLIDLNKTNSDGTIYNGITITDADSINYYREAYKFTSEITRLLGTITPENAEYANGGKYTNLSTGIDIFQGNQQKIFDFNNNNPEDETSSFWQHKREIIKYSIQDNLNMAISLYNGHSTGNFMMPVLAEEEWDQVVNNVSFTTFLQGIPIGNKMYNNYCIITSNKNKELIQEENIYYINEANSNYQGDGSKSYHKIQCGLLDNTNIVGYINRDFDLTTKRDTDGNITSVSSNKKYTACYYCVINESDAYLENMNKFNNGKAEFGTGYESRIRAKYESIARLRQNQYKTNSYLNGT